MRTERDHKKKTPVHTDRIILGVLVAVIIVICCVSAGAYLRRHGWLFGGAGAPDVIRLNDEYSLEKVIAFRKNYRITDIRDGKILYFFADNCPVQTEGLNSGDVPGMKSGAVSIDGEEIIPPGSSYRGQFLAFDDDGTITGTYTLAGSGALKPLRTDSDGTRYYDIGGLTVVSVNAAGDRVLGIPDSASGGTVTLFGGGKDGNGSRWQLSYPAFYGDLAVVRIYCCDCVYRIVKNDRNGR